MRRKPEGEHVRELRKANLYAESGVCMACSIVLTPENWWPSLYVSNYQKCKACRKPEMQQKYQREKEYLGRKWQLEKYGLTSEQLNELENKQDHKCAICKKTNMKEGVRKRLCVDHDHQTGRVRGLLCDSCNRGIGLLKDDPDLLEVALQYLREG